MRDIRARELAWSRKAIRKYYIRLDCENIMSNAGLVSSMWNWKRSIFKILLPRAEAAKLKYCKAQAEVAQLDAQKLESVKIITQLLYMILSALILKLELLVWKYII